MARRAFRLKKDFGFAAATVGRASVRCRNRALARFFHCFGEVVGDEREDAVRGADVFDAGLAVKFNLPFRFGQIFAADFRLNNNFVYFSGGREKIGIVRDYTACQAIDCVWVAAIKQIAEAEEICAVRGQCVVNKRVEAIEPVVPREFGAGCIEQRQRRIEKLLAHIVEAIRLHAENASFAFNAFKNVVIFVAAGVDCAVDDAGQLDDGGGFGEIVRFCLKRLTGVADFKGPGGGGAVFTDDAHLAQSDGCIGRDG